MNEELDQYIRESNLTILDGYILSNNYQDHTGEYNSSGFYYLQIRTGYWVRIPFQV